MCKLEKELIHLKELEVFVIKNNTSAFRKNNYKPSLIS